MNLKIGNSNGRKYLSIVHGYRDPKTKKVKSKTIQSLGYLDELKKHYDDPIAHFRQVVAEMNTEEAKKKEEFNITIDPNSTITSDTRKNIGYAALSAIYHNLGLHIFFNNRSRKISSKFSVNDIMKTEIFSRILFPNSKKTTYENRGLFFEKNQYSLNDVYRCLTFIDTIKNDTQLHIHKKIIKNYNRTCEQVYYDVTNYYFEIDEQDDLRKKGVSKEHRPDPQVQMGLLMDTAGIPISYRLFPGNINDCETLIPIMKDIKRDYGIEKTIIVADRGINTHKNIVFNLLKGDGYVYSQTVRGGHKELKEYVLNPAEYKSVGEDFKIKSRIYPREISVTDLNGTKKHVRIDEKQVIFYSREYDKKAKADRAAAIQKARDLVVNPSRYNQTTSHGSAKYIKNISFDKKTGEIINPEKALMFDEEKLREEEKFDGYYAIITSELDKTDEQIIDIYRGLWKIEESFKVTKSDLKTRPVFVTRENHIQAHFLICFIALTILRILEVQLNNKFSASRIVESLSQANGYPLQENWYHFGYADEVTQAIEQSMGISLTKKYLRLGDIRKILGDTKKQ